MDFFPDNYELQKSESAYFKPQDGENRIRFLSKIIVGWEMWHKNKVSRFRKDEKPILPSDADSKTVIREFWSAIVWNFDLGKIQIFNITQKTVQTAIFLLSKDPDWLSPGLYTIKITKTGKEKFTKYSVMPGQKKPLETHIKTIFQDTPINLEELYEGNDPFNSSSNNCTILIHDSMDSVVSNPQSVKQKNVPHSTTESIETITPNCAEFLTQTLARCSQDYQDKLWASLMKNPGINNFEQLPVEYYKRMVEAVEKNAKENDKKSANTQLDDIFG